MELNESRSPPEGWDTFVASHPLASAYHRAAAVLVGGRAFGLPVTFVWATSRSGEIVGVLPLVEQSSFAFGRFITSVPFFTYGGVLANEAGVASTLCSFARELAAERNAQHLELRHVNELEDVEMPSRRDKVSLVLALPDDEDELARSLGSKLRSQIRRADREEPIVEIGGADLIPEFYSVFAEAMHALGTPVYPKRFFDLVFEALGDVGTFFVIRTHGKVQAAALTIRHGSSIEVPWAAATYLGKRTALNMRLYWEMLKFAVSEKARAFDFGRSSVDSGTFRFKTQWGAVPQQLHWHFWTPDGSEPMVTPSNPKYALAVLIWKKMPLWCANVLGPMISGKLP